MRLSRESLLLTRRASEADVADSTLAHQHLTATFNYSTAKDMFTAIEALLGATLTFDGRVVTLHSGRLGSTAPARYRIHDSFTRQDSKEFGR